MWPGRLYRTRPCATRVKVIQTRALQMFIFLHSNHISSSFQFLHYRLYAPDSSRSIFALRFHTDLTNLPPTVTSDSSNNILFGALPIDFQQTDSLYPMLPHHIRPPPQPASSYFSFKPPRQ